MIDWWLRIPKKCLRQAGLDAFAAMPPRHNTPLNTTNAVASSSSKRPGTSLSTNNPPPLKRSRLDNRGGCLPLEDEDDDDVVIIGDSRDENLAGRKMSPVRDKKKVDDGKLPTRDVLQFFRLDPKKLEYAISSFFRLWLESLIVVLQEEESVSNPLLPPLRASGRGRETPGPRIKHLWRKDLMRYSCKLFLGHLVVYIWYIGEVIILGLYS